MVDAVNPDPDARADADLHAVEERGVPSVTEKRGQGRNILPLVGLGGVVVIGLLFMWQGLKPSGDAGQTLIPIDPVEQFSTGVQGRERIPAFAAMRQERDAPAAEQAPPQPVRQAPPVDRAGMRLQTLRERQRLELERMEREQSLQLRGAREALEMQRQRSAFESEAEVQKALKQRREAPALIFDDSKDEE